MHQHWSEASVQLVSLLHCTVGAVCMCAHVHNITYTHIYAICTDHRGCTQILHVPWGCRSWAGWVPCQLWVKCWHGTGGRKGYSNLPWHSQTASILHLSKKINRNQSVSLSPSPYLFCSVLLDSYGYQTPPPSLAGRERPTAPQTYTILEHIMAGQFIHRCKLSHLR